jgi:hypothetical protein
MTSASPPVTDRLLFLGENFHMANQKIALREPKYF